MKRHRGVTLVELMVSIVVIATAGTALISTLSYLSSSSGATLRQARAQVLADSWLAQITGKSFADPDGVDGEGSYLLYDDVNDYIGFNLVEAGNYTVRATVNAGGLAGVPNNAVWRVDVTVDFDTNRSALATGYRTNRP